MNEPYDRTRYVADESEVEKLSVPNGFRLSPDGESIEVELVFDGEDVTFRSEEGELLEMGMLCYLDHVVNVCVRDHSVDGVPTPALTTIVCNMIQHLHHQYHHIKVGQRMEQLAALRDSGQVPGGLMAVLGALAGGAGGAFTVGPDGELTPLDTDEDNPLATLLGGEGLDVSSVVEGEVVEGGVEESKATDGDGDPIEEIIIGEIPPRRRG